MDELELTPGEDLVMEVLAARWRLGDSLWTFDTAQKRWLVSLEDKGLVSTMHGIVEKTMRASLTEAGKAYYWQDSVPAKGEADRKSPTIKTVENVVVPRVSNELPRELLRLVPRSWRKSKKKKHRRLAKYVHNA